MIDPFLIKETDEQFDVIVVGSGITGGLAAKELCEKGLKVLMVERGRPVKHKTDYISEGKAPWELENRGKVDQHLVDDQYFVQRKCYAFDSATKQFFGNDKEYPYQTAEGKPFDWIRGNQLGGKSLLWHRQSYRWSDIDFEANLKDGHGVDWPIRYKDLAPWYSHVEKFVGISGSTEGIESLPDSEFLPPFDLNAVERHAKKVLKKNFPERDLIIGRTAHLSEPTQYFIDQGRYKCMARNECQRGCSFGAYFSTLSSSLPAALKTNNLKIACNSVVHSVIYDETTQRAKGVKVIDELSLEEREYKANIVFLCASTLGTTQIMLNSISKTFPKGIANSSGALGHYLMDHVYNARAGGVIPGFEEDYHKGRRPTGVTVPRYNHRSKKNNARGFGLFGGAARGSWQHRAGGVEFGAEFKEEIRQPTGWYMMLSGSGEMIPRYENSVTLHPTKKDKWGIPQLLIDCSFSDDEKALMKEMASDAEEMLKSIGAKYVQQTINDDPPGLAIHEVGTARMGRDPKTSVLNGHNQAHDVANLFVTDGSSFSSIAWQNPSLTMMALTVRAADYATSQYRAGKL
ncbi:MAG: choline dehydrogenase-like flavoprotein [Flavobacteriales bacterium]|jgi:choline dehydrogenase-like flavoprotein